MRSLIGKTTSHKCAHTHPTKRKMDTEVYDHQVTKYKYINVVRIQYSINKCIIARQSCQTSGCVHQHFWGTHQIICGFSRLQRHCILQIKQSLRFCLNSNTPKKNTFSRPFNIVDIYIYIYVYRGFPKMGVPPTHPKLNHFSIDTYGFGDPFHFKKPPHLSSMSEIS